MSNDVHALLPQALRWAAEAVHPAAEVLEATRLKGGVSSLVYALSLQADGARHTAVLRLFNDEGWLRNEPDLARREAAVLGLAARNEFVPTPQLVAFDETGAGSGIPAVLMSRLAGAVELTPRDIGGWLDGMAQALAAIHRVEPGGFPWRYRRYCDASQLDASTWSRDVGRWEQAKTIALGPEPAARAGLFTATTIRPICYGWMGR